MSLLDDLRSLNVDDIVSARASISISVKTPGMQGLLSAGPASSALGNLGGNIDSIRASFPNVESLLQPLLDALEGLSGQFDAGSLPLDDYVAAVREGMEFIVRLLASVTGNPSDFGQIFGTSLAEAVKISGDRSGEMANLLGQGADSFADLGKLASQDFTDPRELADLAAQLLLPLPTANLRSAKESIGVVLSAAADLSLPSGRASGLVLALDAVSAAAATGDQARLDAALREVRQVRAHMIGVLQGDLAFAVQQISNLRVPQILRPVSEFSHTIRLGEQGIIEFLNDFREMIRSVRAEMEDPDLETVRQFIRSLPPIIEERARLAIEVPVDTAVERAGEFVRRTLRQLPIRDLRNEITKFLSQLVAAVENAHLDGPANTARNALAEVANRLDAGALTAEVEAALQQANATISGALDGVIDALDTIQQRVDDLAASAESVLDRVAAGLEEFNVAIDSVRAAIDGLGIEQVEQQLVEALSNLRETASALLENLPLPEPLRPQVEQLIALLEEVDFDELFEPVQAVAEELRIPDDVADVVEEGLQEAKRVIDNLIPAELIASIQAEVDSVLETIRGFDPASLLPDVSQYLEEAAQLIESLDARPVAEQMRGPFVAVLGAIDRVHPNRVLAPVIEAYDSLLSEVPVPEAESAVTGLHGAMDAAGRVAGRALVEPVRRASGEADSEVVDPGNEEPTADLPPPPEEVQAGDAIRLLGYVPARLRELLASLDEGPAGDVLREVDDLCAGLARQIREIQTALHDMVRRLDNGLDKLLIPVGPSQLRAQLAIQANFGDSVNFQASLDAVALANPSALRRELASSITAMKSAARQSAASAGGSIGGSLERLAVALESCPFAGLSGDLQALLDALDPEPIAAEMDELVARMIELTPELVAGLLPDMRAFMERVQAIINHYNPGAQAQKFLAILDIVREELDVLNPRRLAAELSELHGAVRASVAAYDPRVLAEELANLTRALAQQIRGLNPQDLLGDLSFLQDAIDRLEDANPATRLASVGDSLTTVGERLAEIDLDALIESINELGPRLVASFQSLAEAVRNEIVALLEALRYAAGSASVSVSAEVSVG